MNVIYLLMNCSIMVRPHKGTVIKLGMYDGIHNNVSLSNIILMRFDTLARACNICIISLDVY